MPAGGTPRGPTGGSGLAKAFTFSIIRVYSPGCARVGGLGIGAETGGVAPPGEAEPPGGAWGARPTGVTGGAGTSPVAFPDSGRACQTRGGEGGGDGPFLVPTACLGSSGAGGKPMAGLPPILSATGLTAGGATWGRPAAAGMGAASSGPVRGVMSVGAVMIPD